MMIGRLQTTHRSSLHTPYAPPRASLFSLDQSSFRYEKLLRSGSKQQSGQTLIEVMIVAALLLTSLLSVIYTYTYLARAQTVESQSWLAAQLAREDVELLRGLRDSNWLASSADWLDGLYSNPAAETETAMVDFAPGSGTSLDFNVTALADAPIYRHQSGGAAYWNQTAADGTPTGFTRLVSLRRFCDRDDFPPAASSCALAETVGIEVTVTVGWQERGEDQQYVLTDYLYNWK
ncbi:prepilin-type N-terminal cleavage/methylation domain-containing protein [Candidatus Falkowbacteria bacterium]|nr:prepilin-type N-terminal cleavage/methylation domain-containing protein [Candidatus Falkowbacteria bacterium]